MSRIFTLIISCLFSIASGLNGAELADLPWAQVCAGKMGEDWYGSEEARALADVVLYLQRDNGGWMKNYEVHLLTDAEKEAIRSEHAEQSCLDNGSTTQEMNFLAKVYHKTGDEKYMVSFNRALDMILQAEKGCGGWSQYWPLTGNSSYQDYITFNDYLMRKVMQILRNVAEDKGDFKGITDEETRTKCAAAYQRGLETVIKCQVDDNGTPSAWCAQHDTISYRPTEGRPFELPSISGCESADLLSFLMTIEKPSPELRRVIATASEWLDAHRIKDKAIEKYINSDGVQDIRIIDREGSSLWGRFIQFGGETGEAIYNAYFDMLKKRGKSRSHTYNGKTYTYTEYEIATSSYRPEMAYQPIYAVYDKDYLHHYYRFLYNFEDTEPEIDSKGCMVFTSLNQRWRTQYVFIDSWAEKLLSSEYPYWQERMKSFDEADRYAVNSLNTYTFKESDEQAGVITYYFDNGISISNSKNKAYAVGVATTNTIKYSASVDYTINLPEGMKVAKIKFLGYDNYADADAYISKCNGKTYTASDYVFPAKDSEGNISIVSHIIDFEDDPAGDKINFTIGGKQCGLEITLFVEDENAAISTVSLTPSSDDNYFTLDGRKESYERLRQNEIFIHKGKKYIKRDK